VNVQPRKSAVCVAISCGCTYKYPPLEQVPLRALIPSQPPEPLQQAKARNRPPVYAVLWGDGPFLYAGLRISTCPITHGRHKGKFAVTVDGNEHLQATKEMEVPSGDANDLLSPVAATEFRSVAGYIGYMVFSFRPELAVECSMLGRVFLSPSNTDARKVNATLA
jgi:hypothetical protein